MKIYKMSFAASLDHLPSYPERAAKRNMSGMDFDVMFGVWTSRAAMLKTVEMQQKREPKNTDWRPIQR